MSVTTTPDSPPRDEPLRIAGRVLPEGLERELWIVDGTISPVRLPGARTLAEDCWVMPALVDAHLHPGVAEIGGPLDLPTLEADLRALAHSGIGAARVVGSPSPIPGNWHARAARYCGRRVWPSPRRDASSTAGDAARTGRNSPRPAPRSARPTGGRSSPTGLTTRAATGPPILRSRSRQRSRPSTAPGRGSRSTRRARRPAPARPQRVRTPLNTVCTF